jgi:hypothetical protein
MNRDPVFDHFEKEFGIHFPEAVAFTDPSWKMNYELAMDAQPSLITTASSGIPSFLTTIVDPNILRILTAKNKAAEILGEERRGDWTQQTAMFPIVEATTEVSSYGDWNNNGRGNANMNFPQRQSYLYQAVPEYGELELDRAGLAKINWANEVREAATIGLNKFQNLSYFKGISGLQNYGMQTDPNLPAPIAPAPKAWGGVGWFNGNVLVATPNEVYTDIQSLITQLILQSSGNIEEEDEIIIAFSPKSSMGLTAANSFGVNTMALLKENFPKIRFEKAIQYGVLTASNPQGIAAGELVQAIAPNVEGQKTGFCAFNVKMRAGTVVRELSAFKQKLTQGTWGAVIRQPFAIAQMLGI